MPHKVGNIYNKYRKFVTCLQRHVADITLFKTQGFNGVEFGSFIGRIITGN
jgi:hypothetical protein